MLRVPTCMRGKGRGHLNQLEILAPESSKWVGAGEGSMGRKSCARITHDSVVPARREPSGDCDDATHDAKRDAGPPLDPRPLTPSNPSNQDDRAAVRIELSMKRTRAQRRAEDQESGAATVAQLDLGLDPARRAAVKAAEETEASLCEKGMVVVAVDARKAKAVRWVLRPLGGMAASRGM